MSDEALQGTGISQLIQAIRGIAISDYDRFELATVTAVLPNITIKVDNMKIALDASDVIIAEQLTQHTRNVTINGGVLSDLVVQSPLLVGDRVIVSSMNNGQTYVVLDKAVVL